MSRPATAQSAIGCAWETAGREAVMLRVTLDGRYVQHLPLSAAGPCNISRLARRRVPPGTHVVRAEIDRELTARGCARRGAASSRSRFEQIHQSRAEYRPLSLAPFVYARPDTVGRFNDVPLFMWYESRARSQRHPLPVTR